MMYINYLIIITLLMIRCEIERGYIFPPFILINGDMNSPSLSSDDRFDTFGFRLRSCTSSCGSVDRTVTRINRRFYLRTRSPHGRCNKLEAITLTPIPLPRDTFVVSVAQSSK